MGAPRPGRGWCGRQDLARAGEGGDPGAGVHRDPADLARGPALHLTGMDSGADPQAQARTPSRTPPAQAIARAGLSNSVSAPSLDY